MVSLISDTHLLDSVGNFVGGRREEQNYEENGAKMAQMEEIRAALAKFCFRQLPSASVAGGLRWFRYFRILSSRQRW